MLWLSGVLAAWYADPPHAYVSGHNDALGPSLLGRRIAVGGNAPRSIPLKFFSIDVRSVYPSVDGRISALHPPKAVWGWSFDAQPEYDWEGGLTGCGTNRSRMRFDGASGSFNAVWALPGVSRTRPNPASPVASEFGASELSASSGPLSVWVDGTVVLQYRRETQVVQCRSFCYWNGCSTQSWVETVNDWAAFPYRRSSAPVSFSLVHPASRNVSLTPWISNYSTYLPSMTAYLHSNSTLYYLQSIWDGAVAGYQRFQSFGLQEDDAGVWSLYSVPNASAASASSAPARFQASSSRFFRYAYHVEQTPAGLPGMHAWTVTGRDFFGDSVDFRQDVLSHAASRLSLALSNSSAQMGQSVQAALRLTDADGIPLTGRLIDVDAAGQAYALTSDGQGRAAVWFSPRFVGANRVVARFSGSNGYAPSSADAVVSVLSGEPLPSSDVLKRHGGVMLLLVLVLGLCLVRSR